MKGKKILVVDDEEDIRDLLYYYLQKEGYLIFTAKNGREAVDVAKKNLPDLILMDMMMPEMDGIQACKIIRKVSELDNCLIAFLTAKNEEQTEIIAFENGADDFIPKPIKPKLLLSRVSGILRRSVFIENVESKAVISINNIVINPSTYLVAQGDKNHSLPKKEFELLYLLASKPNKVFTRESILKSIWEDNVIVTQRTIDVHVRKIREKLGETYIQTIKGVGYKFES